MWRASGCSGMKQLLVINPGSTSTKIALFQDEQQCWSENLLHSAQELEKYASIFEQMPMREDAIRRVLCEKKVDLSTLSCIVARGGLLPPVSAGAIIVDEEMIGVLRDHPVNQHASNLGAALAYHLAQPFGLPCYIYDPVTVDEMIDVVRITGLKDVARFGQGHNLNMRATALRFCKETGRVYTKSNLIVAHLGGGVSLSLHSNGRMIDMISDDDGPFSPERAGLIPTYKLVNLIFNQGLDRQKTMELLQRHGGLMSLVGTSDVRTVEKDAINGDKRAALALEAMALHISRCIANLAVVVNGKIDAIILTGGIAYSSYITGMISKRVSFLAKTVQMPGENEMKALAEGALRVLSGLETPRQFTDAVHGIPTIDGACKM